MKKKVIALSLLITALSVVPAFANTTKCTSNNVNNNYNCYILKKGVSTSKFYNYFINNGNCNNSTSTVKPPVNSGSSNTIINKPSSSGNNTSTSTTTTTSVSKFEQEVVNLVNAERAKYGLSKLTLDSSVSNAARIKSQDMAKNNYFSHTSPTYGNAGSLLSSLGIKYSAYGENIAAGQKTPTEVVNAWMNSSGHRANILSSTFTKIGVGYATNSNGKAYWTQIFTK